jgi:hypothetical protein
VKCSSKLTILDFILSGCSQKTSLGLSLVLYDIPYKNFKVEKPLSQTEDRGVMVGSSFLHKS